MLTWYHSLTCMKKRVYSGIRATGRLHLGNYLGAVKGMLAVQDEYDSIFSVVDLHAMTTPYDPLTLQQSVKDVILDFLAAGLNPEKCHIEIQSQIPEHTELSFLLSTLYPVAKLEDLPTFKEKITQHPKHVNMGLLYYPVLMAADILLYKAELIPVGIDQEPHLEVSREIARKFNQLYGETFPQPRRFKTAGEYVPSLTGEGKMGKSVQGSYINLADDSETIRRKIAKIPTDEGLGIIKNDFYLSKKAVEGGIHSSAPSGGVKALMALVSLFEGEEKKHYYDKLYETSGIRYRELKQELSDAIGAELKPIQEKRTYFENHPDTVKAILDNSREQCSRLADVTMDEVKHKMGLL